jgi:hypothetical protein
LRRAKPDNALFPNGKRAVRPFFAWQVFGRFLAGFPRTFRLKTAYPEQFLVGFVAIRRRLGGFDLPMKLLG